MREISSSDARKNISLIIDHVKETGEPFVISRQNNAEVMLIKIPSSFNKELDEITNFNMYAGSFDFLEDEPDLYSIEDLI